MEKGNITQKAAFIQRAFFMVKASITQLPDESFLTKKANHTTDAAGNFYRLKCANSR